MQKIQIWPFRTTQDQLYAFTYVPELIPASEDFLNPFLGYPMCPLIGRYNQGEYRIAQTKCHFEFFCRYDQQQDCYKCGQNKISIPQKMVQNLRKIPQIIKHNKPPGQNNKNSKIQDVHPLKFAVRDDLKFTLIISFGEVGKDFLNYLNHMYTLAQDLFVDEKLRRSVYMLPIYAYLPYKSGLVEEQVDKGLSLKNYRSEFLSFHLKKGAPAFSPNNMRLGLEGMKKVVSNPAGKKAKKLIQKQQNQQSLDKFLSKNQNKQNQQEQKFKLSEQIQMSLDLFDDNVIEDNKKEEGKKEQSKKDKDKKPQNKKQLIKIPQPTQTNQHKGFVHFYTSVLLQQDYRVYYHWHVDNKVRRQLIDQALHKSNSLIQFLQKCREVLGQEDQCVVEALKLFGLKV